MDDLGDRRPVLIRRRQVATTEIARRDRGGKLGAEQRRVSLKAEVDDADLDSGPAEARCRKAGGVESGDLFAGDEHLRYRPSRLPHEFDGGVTREGRQARSRHERLHEITDRPLEGSPVRRYCGSRCSDSSGVRDHDDPDPVGRDGKPRRACGADRGDNAPCPLDRNNGLDDRGAKPPDRRQAGLSR